MSVVVAYTNKTECSMSFDSGASGGEMIFISKTPKAIKHKGNGLIGIVGSWRVINLVSNLKEQNCTPQNIVDMLKNVTGEETSVSDMEILCAWPNKPLVIIQNDLSVLEITSSVMAIGSGAPYALGYLNAFQEFDKGVLDGAVEAAIKYSTSVSGPVKNIHCALRESLK